MRARSGTRAEKAARRLGARPGSGPSNESRRRGGSGSSHRGGPGSSICRLGEAAFLPALAASVMAVGTFGLGLPFGAGVLEAQPSGAGTQTRGSVEAGSPEAGAEAARALGRAFNEVARQVSDSVVTIRVEARIPDALSGMPERGLPLPPGGDGFARGAGSGVVLRSDGYVLTNHHVVALADRLDVILRDGRSFPGQVVGTDPPSDLAVIKIDTDGLTPVRFGRSEEVEVGQWVVAIGAPFGLDYTVTAGVISAVRRAGIGGSEIEDYVQTDASINPGNSGGPLVNLDGQVVGINTMIAGRGTGIGFAVSADLAQRVGAQLIGEGEVRRPYLGILFQRLGPEIAEQLGADRQQKGALVSEVVKDGPAARAGVLPGDIIVAVDGDDVEDGHDLLRHVLSRDVGQRVHLEVLRGGERQTIQVVTAERPQDPQESVPEGGAAPEEPGGDLGEPTRGTRTRGSNGSEMGLRMRMPVGEDAESSLAGGSDDGGGGVIVTHVTPGSPAARAQIRPGDVIVEADRRRVESPQQVVEALSDGAALLRLDRRGSAFYTVVRASRPAQ